jgi:hypothetical protein
MKATKEQLAEWKAKHGDVFCIKVDEKVCYLKKPGRKALGYATVAGKENPMKFNETLLNECWLGGDEDIKTNDDLFLSISAILPEIITKKEAELVKL